MHRQHRVPPCLLSGRGITIALLGVAVITPMLLAAGPPARRGGTAKSSMRRGAVPKVLIADQRGAGQRLVGAYQGSSIDGAERVVYITGRHIRREVQDRSWDVDPAKIEAQLDAQCDPSYDGFILLDYEEDRPEAPMAIHRALTLNEFPWAPAAYCYLEQILDTTKRLRPNARVGFYDIPLIRTGHGQQWLDAYQAGEDTPLLRLWRKVDFVSPSLYYTHDDQHRRATKNLRYAVVVSRSLGIPTYVHVMHREHSHAGARIYDVNEFVERQVTPSVERGADGVFVWNALYQGVPETEYAEVDAFIRPYIEAAVDNVHVRQPLVTVASPRD